MKIETVLATGAVLVLGWVALRRDPPPMVPAPIPQRQSNDLLDIAGRAASTAGKVIGGLFGDWQGRRARCRRYAQHSMDTTYSQIDRVANPSGWALAYDAQFEACNDNPELGRGLS